MKINTLFLIILFCIVLTACKKENQLNDASANDALVTFNIVSAQLQSDLAAKNNCYVLIDRADTTYQPLNLSNPELPYFNNNYKFQYPTNTFNAGLQQSWAIYGHIKPGAHTLNLIDSAHYLRNSSKINLAANKNFSIYYADSLGYFRSFVLQDELINQPGKVRLRFLDFCPDATELAFNIDDKPAAQSGFVNKMNYGTTTGFVNYDTPRPDTLKIDFYQPSDPQTIVATTFLKTQPGRSYTLALMGYLSGFASYPDPKNNLFYKQVGISLSVVVNTNN